MPLNTLDIARADDDQDDSMVLKEDRDNFIEDLNHTKVW